MKRTVTVEGPSKRQKKFHSSKSRRPSVQTQVIRALQQTEETKYVEVYNENIDPTTAGSIVCINEIAEGTDYNERIGRRVRMKYLQIDVSFNFSSADTGTSVGDVATFHVVLDRQANGSAPTVSQILDTSIVGVTQAWKNIQGGAERFKILKTFATQVNNQGDIARERFFIDLSKMKPEDTIVQFAGGTALVPYTNALFVLYACAEQSSGFINISWASRFVYTDM